ncbi:MAG: dihydroorotate dehydrogenase-like protein [Rhodocyclaceae bacterium]|nr:dihydroorotate dehydrogenase-like protein [Rhodocyclaceae bacterium]
MKLQTSYMGLKLAHPIVASASPLSADLGKLRHMEDAGAAAVVLFSLFEEQIERDNAAYEHYLNSVSDSHAESAGYLPAPDSYPMGPEGYLELIRRARAAVDIPVIASLNGVSAQGWTDYARQIEQAGAAALELNVYYLASPDEDGRAVEQRYLDVLAAVKGAVSLPVALKLSPYFSSVGHMALSLARAGADGLVLFNRFYQPDFDIDRLEVARSLDLSTAADIRLPLTWIAALYGRLPASIAASGGVDSAREVIKYLLAGADVVMTTAALLRHGIGHLGVLRDGLEQWMDERGFGSVADFRGELAQLTLADPAAFDRANYIHILESYRA